MMPAMKLAALLVALAFAAVPAQSEAQAFRSKPTAKAKAKPKKSKAKPKKSKAKARPEAEVSETTEAAATDEPTISSSKTRQDKVSETDVVVIIDGE